MSDEISVRVDDGPDVVSAVLTVRDGLPGPPGPPGEGGGMVLKGPGRPDIPETTNGAIKWAEPVGTLYVSTDGAGVGAWVWMRASTKRSFPSKGWVVLYGDTGNIHIAGTDDSTYVDVRRTHEGVSCQPYDAIAHPMDGPTVTRSTGGLTHAPAYVLPDWARPSQYASAPITPDPFATSTPVSQVGVACALPRVDGWPPHVWCCYPSDPGVPVMWDLRWETTAPWPTSLT